MPELFSENDQIFKSTLNFSHFQQMFMVISMDTLPATNYDVDLFSFLQKSRILVTFIRAVLD